MLNAPMPHHVGERERGRGRERGRERERGEKRETRLKENPSLPLPVPLYVSQYLTAIDLIHDSCAIFTGAF